MDIVGIGNIVVTLVVGIFSCLITWVLTKKSLKKQKIKYSLEVIPMLSSEIIKNSDGLDIYYKNSQLSNPCLLSVNIYNTGNCAISNPPIKVISNDESYIIPGYIEDMPSGYEGIWSLEKVNDHESHIHLEHINEKQVVKARFYLNCLPEKVPILTCPMMDLELKEVNKDILFLSMKEIVLNSLALPGLHIDLRYK